METQITVSNQVNVPVMDRVRFSELTGIEIGVINGWINNGYLPSLKMGKHRLINMALLSKDCMEQVQ